MYLPAWQVSLYPEKTKDVGKGQRKGTLNHQKGRGMSEDVIID